VDGRALPRQPHHRGSATRIRSASYIERQAQARGLANLRVITRDINDFDTAAGHFDRVVSVEMFEHLRNWPLAFARVARWLKPDGKFFMHVFTHHRARPTLSSNATRATG
jgi:cyclopropane fatty-acyl-phospholipid synthase-like methyltransferase